MTDLITEARELHAGWMAHESIHHGGGQGAKSDDGEAERKFMLWIADEFPAMCDALEKAEEQNKQLLHEVCKLACESVEREKTLAKLEAEVMATCNSVRWIPVTERLPKTEKPVQVYMPKLHMSVQTGFYTKYYGEDDGEWYEHWVASGDVTHWQPLPAPPEEGEKI